MDNFLKAVMLVVILTRPYCQCSFLPAQIEAPVLNEVGFDAPEEYYRKDFLIDLPPGTPEEEKEVPGEPLTPEDFQNAENLEILEPPMDEDSIDPIEAAGLFEGDIAGINPSDIVQKNAIRNMNMRWSGGVIPYVISAAFNKYERSVIAAAFLDYHKKTCLRFVPRTNQGDYVYLEKGVGCSSQVGRNGRRQQVSLGVGCVYKGVVIHELMHAVGFWHEQSRTDRDQYISILWRNIQPAVVSGRMVQPFEQLGQTQFLTTITEADNINHVAVFLTGAIPFPEGMGGLVYFSWPEPQSPPTWQLLGYIAEDKPSAIFKISNLRKGGEGNVNPFVSQQFCLNPQVGISIEPIVHVQQQAALVADQNLRSYAEFGQKMLENLFNYAASFAVKRTNINPNSNEVFVPLSTLQSWYSNFQRRLQQTPNFWRS